MSQAHNAFMILIPGSGNTALTSQRSGSNTISIAVLPDIEAASRLAKELVSQGIESIELSASFGSVGQARLREIVGPTIKLGRVQFEE